MKVKNDMNKRIYNPKEGNNKKILTLKIKNVKIKIYSRLQVNLSYIYAV